jgi:hypothetical protein
MYVTSFLFKQVWPRKKTFKCDYWWPLDFTGVPVNDSARYLTPMTTAWGVGNDRWSKEQDISSVFYGFTASDDEIVNNHVMIPHEARAHFVAAGEIGSWDIAMDLGPEEVGSTSASIPQGDGRNDRQESDDEEEAERLHELQQRRGRKN